MQLLITKQREDGGDGQEDESLAGWVWKHRAERPANAPPVSRH